VRLFSGFGAAEKFQVRASDIMAADPLCVTADTPPDEVAYLMSERRVGSVTIENVGGHIAGDLYGY